MSAAAALALVEREIKRWERLVRKDRACAEPTAFKAGCGVRLGSRSFHEGLAYRGESGIRALKAVHDALRGENAAQSSSLRPDHEEDGALTDTTLATEPKRERECNETRRPFEREAEFMSVRRTEGLTKQIMDDDRPGCAFEVMEEAYYSACAEIDTLREQLTKTRQRLAGVAGKLRRRQTPPGGRGLDAA